MNGTITREVLAAIDEEAIRIAIKAEENVANFVPSDYKGCFIAVAIIGICDRFDILQKDVREEMWTLIKHHRARLQETPQITDDPDNVIELKELYRNIEESNIQFKLRNTHTES